ncbi:MAG: hypothetical protein ABEI86_10325 [Halobacteriaceae archaeon]
MRRLWRANASRDYRLTQLPMSYPEQIVKDEIHVKREQSTIPIGIFDRDMRRLRDLRDMYFDGNGLNHHEHEEVRDLLEKWEIEYTEWTRRNIFLN